MFKRCFENDATMKLHHVADMGVESFLLDPASPNLVALYPYPSKFIITAQSDVTGLQQGCDAMGPFFSRYSSATIYFGVRRALWGDAGCTPVARPTRNPSRGDINRCNPFYVGIPPAKKISPPCTTLYINDDGDVVAEQDFDDVPSMLQQSWDGSHPFGVSLEWLASLFWHTRM